MLGTMSMLHVIIIHIIIDFQLERNHTVYDKHGSCCRCRYRKSDACSKHGDGGDVLGM